MRLAFSMTISETCTCRDEGSSNVELMTSQFLPLTSRSMSVTSSGRSSIKQHDDVGFREVDQHGTGHFLQQDRLAGTRRTDDQPSLAEADGSDHVDDARGDFLRRSFPSRCARQDAAA